MKVLLTGATGFIGNALLKQLVSRGWEVAVLSRKPRPDDVQVVSDWIKLEEAGLAKPFNGSRPDAVVHLAGRAHVLSESGTNTIEAFRRVNVGLTLELATQAASVGVKRFVFVSTVGVHGRALLAGDEVSEKSPLDPLDDYATSKLEAELALRDIAARTGMELAIVRPALVVGPHAPGNLHRLKSLVARRLPIPVPSSSNQRSFVALENLCHLLLLCLEHRNAMGEAFVVAEEGRPSTEQVMKWIGAGMGRNVNTVPVRGAVLRTSARIIGKADLYDKLYGDLRIDATKARQLLGWDSEKSLADAFRELGAAHVR